MSSQSVPLTPGCNPLGAARRALPAHVGAGRPLRRCLHQHGKLREQDHDAPAHRAGLAQQQMDRGSVGNDVPTDGCAACGAVLKSSIRGCHWHVSASTGACANAE